MQRKMKTAFIVGALMTGMAGPSLAQDTELEQMRSEMAQMRAEMAQMRAQQQADWTDQARRAEIDGMIRDVLSDANTRASLLQEGLLAGIDEKGKIFLASGDGQFKVNFSGQVQARYVWNTLDTDNTSGTRASESLSGIQMRRVKFNIAGQIADGWGYKINFATNRATANAFIEDAYITYDLGNGWEVLAGSAKLPFARQELVSATRQVAADRALVTEFFTLNRSDLVQLSYENDDIRGWVALSDGGNANFTEFTADVSNDVALTGRVDWKAIGDDWGASKDEFGSDVDALFVGGAMHYEVAEGSAAGLPESGFAWTVDALWKTSNVGLTAAVFGNHTDNGTAVDTDQYGLYIQGDVKLDDAWDVFARWEWIDDDGVSAAATDEVQALTVGVNHTFSKNVRFTADVVWIYEGDAPTADGNFVNGGALSSSLGLTSTAFTAADDHEDQIALRLQLQLLF